MRTEGKWVADNGDSEIWAVFSDIDSDGIAYLCEPDGKPLRSFEESEANAQYIVKAVNNHEALVEALAECAHELDQMLLSHHAQEAYLQARAALKEAEMMTKREAIRECKRLWKEIVESGLNRKVLVDRGREKMEKQGIQG